MSKREIKLMIELKLDKIAEELANGKIIEIAPTKDGITVRKVKKDKIQ